MIKLARTRSLATKILTRFKKTKKKSTTIATSPPEELCARCLPKGRRRMASTPPRIGPQLPLRPRPLIWGSGLVGDENRFSA